MVNNKLLTQYDIFRITGNSPDTIKKRESLGLFPKRFKIDKTHIRWNSDEVNEWLKENPQSHHVPN